MTTKMATLNWREKVHSLPHLRIAITTTYFNRWELRREEFNIFHNVTEVINKFLKLFFKKNK